MKLVGIILVFVIIMSIISNYTVTVFSSVFLVCLLCAFYFEKSSKNELLKFILLFISFAHFIGGIHAIINYDSYEETGWKAIGKFDFSISQLFNVYLLVWSSIIFLSLFVMLFKRDISLSVDSSILNRETVKKNKSSFFFTLIVLIHILFLVLSISAFNYKIGLSGVEPTELPFHLVGIFHISRGYIAPLFCMILYQKIKPSVTIRGIILFSSLLIGVFSGSRGTTLFFLFPLILELIQKGSLSSNLRIMFLFILGFLLPSSSRIIYSLFPDLTASEHLLVVFRTGLNPGGENEFSLSSFFNELIGFSHRFYGFQDAILASQYPTYPSFQSFLKFLLSGNIEIIMPSITTQLYGLEFPEGVPFGVAMGWVGIATFIMKGNLLFGLIYIVYSSFLVVLANMFVLKLASLFEALSSRKIISGLFLILSMLFISGSIVDFYYVMFFLVILLIIGNIIKKFKYAANNNSVRELS